MDSKLDKDGRWISKMAIGLGLGLLTFLALGLWADLGKLTQAILTFNHKFLVPIFLLSLVNYGIRAVRWHYYLKVAGHKIPIGISVGVFASGLAMSVTPGKLGEVIKVSLLNKMVPGPRAFSIVVTERLADLFAVLMLAAGGVIVLKANSGVLIGGVVLTAGMFFMLATGPGSRLTFKGASILLRGKVSVDSAAESAALVRQLLSGKVLVNGLVMGLLAWFAEAAGLWLVVLGFQGSELGLGSAVFIYAVGTLAGALSFLPGGLIATEATLAVLLVNTAFPQLATAGAEAFAAASTLLIRIATLWFAVLVGVIGLLVMGKVLGASKGAPSKGAIE